MALTGDIDRLRTKSLPRRRIAAKRDKAETLQDTREPDLTRRFEGKLRVNPPRNSPWLHDLQWGKTIEMQQEGRRH